MRANTGLALKRGFHKLRALTGQAPYQPLAFQPVGTPPQTLPCKPGLYDPGTLDRVEACGFKSTMEKELAKLDATQFIERPMQVARIQEATVIGGEIFSGWQRHFMVTRPTQALSAIEDINGPVTLANSEQGLKYFGHWLLDDCAMQAALHEEVGGGGPVLSMQRPNWSDAASYERAFEQSWDERAAFRTPELTLARDLGFNLKKRARIERLRARLRAVHQPSDPGSIIYLTRGPSGASRDVDNEAELQSSLTARGVKVIVPEGDGDTLIQSLLEARIIITVEGSQANHATYALADRGGLLILQPPIRFYNPHVEWTRLLDMDYATIVGASRRDGFYIDPDEVLNMIDRLLALETV